MVTSFAISLSHSSMVRTECAISSPVSQREPMKRSIAADAGASARGRASRIRTSTSCWRTMLARTLLLMLFRFQNRKGLCAGLADKVAVTLRVTGRCLPHAEREAYLASTFGGEPKK